MISINQSIMIMMKMRRTMFIKGHQGRRMAVRGRREILKTIKVQALIKLVQYTIQDKNMKKMKITSQKVIFQSKLRKFTRKLMNLLTQIIWN